MNKFIWCASLLLLLGLVSSELEPFSIISGNNGYALSNELRGTFAQQGSQAGGYHEAKIYFNTTVPSINPDQAGVNNIECKDDKIVLSLKDDSAIQQISDWPNKMMILVSHKWNCFGLTTTDAILHG